MKTLVIWTLWAFAVFGFGGVHDRSTALANQPGTVCVEPGQTGTDFHFLEDSTLQPFPFAVTILLYLAVPAGVIAARNMRSS